MTLLNTSLNAIEIRFPRRLAVLGPVAAACGLLLIAPLGQSRGDAAQAHQHRRPCLCPHPGLFNLRTLPRRRSHRALFPVKDIRLISCATNTLMDSTTDIRLSSISMELSPLDQPSRRFISHETGIVQLTCHDVPADGSQATVTYRYLSLIVTVNGLHRELSDAQLRQLSEAMPSMRTTQSGKLVSVGSSASPGPISEMMSSSQMLQGAPLPEAATAIGGTWRGVASALGAKTYALSSLDSVATDSKGDQIFTINQKLSEQSTQNAPTSPTTPHLGRFYIYETGTGQQTSTIRSAHCKVSRLR